MQLIQVCDVPEATINALKARAAEQGLTLTDYLRAELDRLARRNRRGGPSIAEVLAKIRRNREVS
jgi:hypothetical protein